MASPKQDDRPKEVRPPGEPLNWTDEEAERLSRITPAVIADAKADLRRRDPELARKLEG